MTLESLGIGKINGIDTFWWLDGNQVNWKKSIETSKPMSVIETTSTPKKDALNTQNMSFSTPVSGRVNNLTSTATLLQRWIEDMQKNNTLPVISMNKWFWWISGINKPVVWNDVIPVQWAEKTNAQNFNQDIKNSIWAEAKWNIARENVDIDLSLKDLTADMSNVIAEWRVPDIAKLKQLYPEFNKLEDSVLQDLTNDIGNVVREWRTIDMEKLKTLYPEMASLDVMQKSEVQWKNPIARWTMTILEWTRWLLKWAYEWVVPWFTELVQNSKDILNSNKTSWEKFAQILIGEFGMNYLWGIIGDTIAWWAKGVYTGFTSESERKYFSEKGEKIIWQMLEEAKNQYNVSNVKKLYDSLSEDEQKELWKITEYSLNAANFVWVSELWAWAVNLWKAWIDLATQWVAKTMWPITEKLGVKFAKKTITEAEVKAIQSTPEMADKLIDNLHKFTTSEIRNYKSKFGETPGQTLNNRWLIAGGEETLTTSLDDMAKYQTQKKAWLSNIKETIPVDDDVIKMAQEVAEHERTVMTPSELKATWWLTKYDELLKKAEQGKLTHMELEDIKSTFERKKALKYDALRTSTEQERLTNLDSAIREKQQKRAEQGWFDNIKDINKEISKSKAISDLLVKDIDKLTWLSISDYVLLAESSINPATLSLFVTKKIAQSGWFRKWLIKALNKINWRASLVEKIADLQKIRTISTETEFNNFLKQGELKNLALPKATPWAANAEWINFSKDVTPPIRVTPEWQAIRQWQISELPLSTKQTDAPISNNSNSLDNLSVWNSKTKKVTDIFQWNAWEVKLSKWKNLKLGEWYYFGWENQASNFWKNITKKQLGELKLYEAKNTQEFQYEASKNGWKDKFIEKLKSKWYDWVKAYNTAFKDYEYNIFNLDKLK